MQITYLDGSRLKRALIAASRQVHKYREQLNTINVFPVADSDTGTNMSGTLKSLTGGLIRCADRSLPAVSKAAADSALTGARGNSGTILSQFFYGIAAEIQDRSRIDARAFSEIARKAVDYTYKALSEPVEGTILTVMRVWSEKMLEVSRKTEDFAELFSESLTYAKEALQDTRRLLPILRKAKVVDAGALGFVHMVEGIVHFIERGKIREVEQVSDLDLNETPHITSVKEEINFRYCTECIIEGENIDHGSLRIELAALGDSLIVAGSPSRAKVHIHADNPEEAFRIAERYGTLTEQKADDMHKQYAAAHTPHSEIALVVDSTCDIPPELLEKSFVHIVPVKVLFGEESYLDKVALTPQHFYELLRTRTGPPGTTSQPAPGDFEKTFAFLTDHYRQVIYLSIAGALSGTLKSARTALERLEKRDAVHIFDSRSLTIGSGLIARRVIEAVERGDGIAEISNMIADLTERTRILITIPSLDALIRSGRIGRAGGLIARLLKLRPLLTLDAQGRVVKAAMVRGDAAGKAKIIAMLRERLGDGARTDFAAAHVDSPDTAAWFKTEIERYFKPDREVYFLDASPALALHTGFGTAAVAYLEPPPAGDADRRK